MTREEAIEILQNGAKYEYDENFDDELYEARKVAIEALKAEPCEDAVSRQAVGAVLDWHEHEKSEIESYIWDIAEDIKALPPVTPKQRWIPEGATNGDALCMLFPNMHYTLSDKSPRVVTTIGVASSFDVDWWNAPYKEGEGEEE